jgi:hypothetical protein
LCRFRDLRFGVWSAKACFQRDGISHADVSAGANPKSRNGSIRVEACDARTGPMFNPQTPEAMLEAAKSEAWFNGDLLPAKTVGVALKHRFGGLFGAMLANALEDCPTPPSQPQPQQSELLGNLACEIEPEPVEWALAGPNSARETYDA